jgi:hypothetical protein
VKHFIIFLSSVAGCGGGGPAAPDGGAWPEPPAPAPIARDGVRRETFTVDGPAPPANPANGATTPASLNQTFVLRYRIDVDPPAPARAVVLAWPGYLGGAGSFEPLARALVQRGAAAGAPVEVWAIDRRSSGLEDHRGLLAADAADDPEVAAGYYFGDATVGGRAYAGPPSQADVPFASEWGLATHVGDLQALLALVPATARRGHVFLLGHSLGGGFAEAFAAWRFSDGTDGTDQLAGLILVDGVLAAQPIAEADWHAGVPSDPLPSLGVDEIRAVNRYVVLPLLGVDVYPRLAILSRRALAHPAQATPDAGRG